MPKSTGLFTRFNAIEQCRHFLGMSPMPFYLILVIVEHRDRIRLPRQIPCIELHPRAKRRFSRTRDFLALEPAAQGSI